MLFGQPRCVYIYIYILSYKYIFIYICIHILCSNLGILQFFREYIPCENLLISLPYELVKTLCIHKYYLDFDVPSESAWWFQWFQIRFILKPTWVNDPIWLFQMGWNHQLVIFNIELLWVAVTKLLRFYNCNTYRKSILPAEDVFTTANYEKGFTK